jgi:hypothetical protein
MEAYQAGRMAGIVSRASGRIIIRSACCRQPLERLADLCQLAFTRAQEDPGLIWIQRAGNPQHATQPPAAG